MLHKNFKIILDAYLNKAITEKEFIEEFYNSRVWYEIDGAFQIISRNTKERKNIEIGELFKNDSGVFVRALAIDKGCIICERASAVEIAKWRWKCLME